jgi:hypothetical protein
MFPVRLKDWLASGKRCAENGVARELAETAAIEVRAARFR